MTASVRGDERALKLMAYADGELEGADLAEVEKWLKEDAEAVLFANDLAELGSYVQEGHKARKAPSFDIADAIMAKISDDALEKAPEKAAEKPAPKLVPFRPIKKSNPVRTYGWIAAGLALAASVFLVTRGKHEESPLAQTTSPLVQPGSQVAAAVSAGSVDVENPGSSVSVIYVPDEKSTVPNVTTVVWVNEGK